MDLIQLLIDRQRILDVKASTTKLTDVLPLHQKQFDRHSPAAARKESRYRRQRIQWIDDGASLSVG